MFKPNIIILGPGGIKGYLELGSLLYLESNNLLEDVKEYVGVSIGSLISLFIISQYSIKDIIYLFLKLDNMDKIDFKHFIENFYLFPIDKIRNKIEKYIKKKWGKVLTLEELYNATGIILTIVVSNNKTRQHEFMNKDTYPDLNCIDAVLYSMNIPLVFPKMTYNNILYTDGVFTCPFPSIYYNKHLCNILCLYITTINYYIDNNIFSYVYNNINMMIERNRDLILKENNDNCKIIFLESNITDLLGINVSIEERSLMYIKGYNTIKTFYENI